TPATSVVLTDNITRVRLFLSQSGAVVQTNNSLTPPAGAHIFLGSAVTAAGAITSVDFSGVVYLNTMAHRWTTDASPGDTPPANLSFIHHSLTDLWLWDGAAYYHL